MGRAALPGAGRGAAVNLPDLFDWPSLKRALSDADNKNRKLGRDIELVSDRLILRSPDGTRFIITVDNSGNLGTTAL